MELTLAQIQQATAAQSDAIFESAKSVRGWSIDSRTAAPGDIFFALRGDKFNGHDFVLDVLEKGVAGVIVSEPVRRKGNVLRVADTLRALQQLADFARVMWAKPVVAVTGSAGKTSTKDIIAELLAVRLQVGKTIGNFNNHVGLPLSILRLPEGSEVGVLEMGMNHAGEIRELCRIATPDVGVVTNVGFAHVENFRSIEEVAAAKRELIEALPASGTAVLNADDPHVAKFRTAHKGPTLTYGFSEGAEVRAEKVFIAAGRSEFTVQGTRFCSQLSGRHGVLNMLAGIAVASLFHIEAAELVTAISELAPGKMRGERQFRGGVTILNDAYNSNPEAARNMLDVLRDEPGTRRIAVLGEMRELGQMSELLHRELGAYAAALGVDLLVGIRGTASAMVEEAMRTGLSADRAIFFESPQEAGEYLKGFVLPGDAVLFKGSRGTHVELALATMEARD